MGLHHAWSERNNFLSPSKFSIGILAIAYGPIMLILSDKPWATQLALFDAVGIIAASLLVLVIAGSTLDFIWYWFKTTLAILFRTSAPKHNTLFHLIKSKFASDGPNVLTIEIQEHETNEDHIHAEFISSRQFGVIPMDLTDVTKSDNLDACSFLHDRSSRSSCGLCPRKNPANYTTPLFDRISDDSGIHKNICEECATSIITETNEQISQDDQTNIVARTV